MQERKIYLAASPTKKQKPPGYETEAENASSKFTKITKITI
jgi:hypothetical protein